MLSMSRVSKYSQIQFACSSCENYRKYFIERNVAENILFYIEEKMIRRINEEFTLKKRIISFKNILNIFENPNNKSLYNI